mmetsp:Transcript_18110/g.36132  ORF Transcript_18110/g.36132 Transcript_18110/m.36132 type:complete len:762 (-) Transcript_18110:165-2450(-)
MSPNSEAIEQPHALNPCQNFLAGTSTAPAHFSSPAFVPVSSPSTDFSAVALMLQSMNRAAAAAAASSQPVPTSALASVAPSPYVMVTDENCVLSGAALQAWLRNAGGAPVPSPVPQSVSVNVPILRQGSERDAATSPGRAMAGNYAAAAARLGLVQQQPQQQQQQQAVTIPAAPHSSTSSLPLHSSLSLPSLTCGLRNLGGVPNGSVSTLSVLNESVGHVHHHHHPNTVAEFLYQLTKMLTDDNREVIEWSAGRIHVHSPERLARDVLHHYFRHSKYASFQRQLNYFGFRKLAGKGKMAPCSYFNEACTADLRSVLGIKRKTNGGGGREGCGGKGLKRSLPDAGVTRNASFGAVGTFGNATVPSLVSPAGPVVTDGSGTQQPAVPWNLSGAVQAVAFLQQQQQQQQQTSNGNSTFGAIPQQQSDTNNATFNLQLGGIFQNFLGTNGSVLTSNPAPPMTSSCNLVTINDAQGAQQGAQVAGNASQVVQGSLNVHEAVQVAAPMNPINQMNLTQMNQISMNQKNQITMNQMFFPTTAVAHNNNANASAMPSPPKSSITNSCPPPQSINNVAQVKQPQAPQGQQRPLGESFFFPSENNLARLVEASRQASEPVDGKCGLEEVPAVPCPCPSVAPSTGPVVDALHPGGSRKAMTPALARSFLELTRNHMMALRQADANDQEKQRNISIEPKVATQSAPLAYFGTGGIDCDAGYSFPDDMIGIGMPGRVDSLTNLAMMPDDDGDEAIGVGEFFFDFPDDFDPNPGD